MGDTGSLGPVALVLALEGAGKPYLVSMTVTSKHLPNFKTSNLGHRSTL